MSLELINRVVELTNVERAKAGLQPLTLNLQLADAAQDHSNDMAQDDFFSHTGADGSTVGTRVQDSGYEFANAGENIAVGQTTAEQVVESWMNSPGHRANILNENFTEIGIGYTYLENDTGSVNYNHYWTQVFGKPLNNNSGNVSPEPVSEPTADPVTEIVVSEQLSPVEDSGNNNDLDFGLDSNPSPAPQESEPKLEEASKPILPILIEEVEADAPAEDIINEVVVEQSDLLTESPLESEETADFFVPTLEIENSEQSSPLEDESDRSLDIVELSVLESEHRGDLSGGAPDSVLTGGDAIDSFVYVETSTSTNGNDIKFDYLQEQSKSWLGMAAETQINHDSLDLFEFDFNSSWTEAKQSVLQQIAESFL